MITQEELNSLRPGDGLIVKDTSNNKDLNAYFRRHGPNGEVIVFMERFNDTMRFQEDGRTGLGRFYIDRKVGL